MKILVLFLILISTYLRSPLKKFANKDSKKITRVNRFCNAEELPMKKRRQREEAHKSIY